MRYAIVKNLVVENITVCDTTDYAESKGWILVDDTVEIGNRYENGVFTKSNSLEKEKENKLARITLQDKVTEQFFVNSMPMWLDKETRTSLRAITLPALQEAGETSTTLWYESDIPLSLKVPIDWMLQKLNELEVYAKKTYDTTQAHIAAVKLLETIEEMQAYDPTTGYPDVLHFTLN